MKTPQSPCAADALFGTTTITVNGKTIGIAGLCTAIEAVRASGISGEDRIRAALLLEVGAGNYIPEYLRDAYADTLLDKYYAAAGNGRGTGDGQ